MRSLRVGCCITPHGFGHAARTAAVIQELERRTAVECVIVTTVPRWFFEQSIDGEFRYHSLQTDIGMIQQSSLRVDVKKTVDALENFFPVHPQLVHHTAALFAGCDLVLCDIAPVGILAAQEIGCPSVLLENFTWDWIYNNYLEQDSRIGKYGGYLQDIYSQANYHVQAMPCCRQTEADLHASPIARPMRGTSGDIRRYFNLTERERLVLVTMGGGSGGVATLPSGSGCRDVHFVFPGYCGKVPTTDNLHVLAQQSTLYHPDLVAAADVVIGKVGYSTLAEVYQAGTVFGYVSRPNFPESPALCRFIRNNIPSLELTEAELARSDWGDTVVSLLAMSRIKGVAERRSGAGEVAEFLLAL